MKTPTLGNPPATRDRLLEAAGQVFARAGFREARVREIATRAEANVAAVNYHFRGKEGLYSAVLERSFRIAMEKYPPDGGLGPWATPPERLRAFIQSLLYRLLTDGPHAQYAALMAREMVEPTAALDRIARQVIRPMYVQLCSLVGTLAGVRPSQERVRRCARSIVGQCLFYKHAEPVLRRLEGRWGWTPRDLEELTDHIQAFSLAGIRQIAKGGGSK